jgi:DNA (cytosine-5)-methyltransferase 1
MAIGSVISLFTGAMGLDLGFEDVGFEVRVSVEKDPWAVETIRANRPSIPVIPRDIHEVTTAEILEKAGLSVDEVTVLTGASPCEPFSTAGRRMSIEDSRAKTVDEFIRVINDARPLFFVFEQVPGFTRAAKRHISFYERVKKRPEDIHPDERLGSAFEEIMAQFRDTGYALSYNGGNPQTSILNAADYGSPQRRKRFVLIGAREGQPVALLEKTHGAPDSPEVIRNILEPWATLRDALAGLNDPQPEYLKFPHSWGKYLAYIPPGGYWKDLPEELYKEALGGAYDETGSNLKGGRTGFLRRLAWDKPAPTIVDRPNTKAACLCHPDEDRPLSVKEYARLQGFPDDWVFEGPLPSRYELIGQATPIPLARALAFAVKAALETEYALREKVAL